MNKTLKIGSVVWILAALFLLCVASSCTMVKSIRDGLQATNRLVGTTQVLITKTGDMMTRTVDEINKYEAAADKNKDGETTPEEWIAYLVALAGVAGVLIRNAKSNARKDALEVRVKNIEASTG